MFQTQAPTAATPPTGEEVLVARAVLELHGEIKFQKTRIAAHAVALIAKLCDVQREAPELQPEAGQRLRQQRARPVADALHAWLGKQRMSPWPTTPAACQGPDVLAQLLRWHRPRCARSAARTTRTPRMTAWSHGYVADSPYTFAYQAEPAPGNLALTCAMMGVAWQPGPRMVVADIGCGRGYTANVLAAANPGWTVLGLDYNPAHVCEAAALAEGAQLSNAVFVDADLSDMSDSEIDQLPELDVVSLHGVWTWVSDAVRAGIVRLLSRRLKAGGLCYLGYNALPAFGEALALQRLVRHLAAQQPHGSSSQRVHAARKAIRTLLDSRPVNLPISRLLQLVADDEAVVDPAYLAHEFLTEHWRPVFFEDLCAELARAKLDYVGSTGLHENVPDLLFTPEQRRIHDELSPGAPREFLKDLCTKRGFRRDVFVRGLRRTDPVAALDRIVLAACRIPGDASPKLAVPVGVAELGSALWPPIRAALDEGPCSLGELRRLPASASPNPAELATVLVGTGLAMPVFRDGGTTDTCLRFNRWVARSYAEEGRLGGQYAMASPAAASALACGWLELAVATQPEAADATPPDPAMIARRLVPDVDAQSLLRATEQVDTLLRERPRIWRRFGII